MEITKTNQTTNVNAIASSEAFDYVFNYALQEGKITNVNGSVSKKGADSTPVQLGNFNIYGEVENQMVGCNFNANSSIEEKQAILSDIYAIQKQLFA